MASSTDTTAAASGLDQQGSFPQSESQVSMSTEQRQTLDLGNAGRELVLACTGASEISSIERVQTLWSGYGDIARVRLAYSGIPRIRKRTSVVVKYIHPPTRPSHPRGWHSDTSEARKLTSYQVEVNWYKHYSQKCHTICRMPAYLASQSSDNNTWLVLEDLESSHPRRHTSLTSTECVPCLQWLARFHAQHFTSTSEGLWPIGSYWHLQTRKDEWMAMRAGRLKDAAQAIDNKLTNCRHTTLIHGDAKVANMCFSTDSADIAMVDFQYVGGGCGIRDVAYFLGSCLSESDCEKHASDLLDRYFEELNQHLPMDLKSSVEREWRDLYTTAWADFQRFLSGWMPGHQKINGYSEAMTQQALDEL